MLSQVKLIAEPWDLGAGGYQVGNFPVLWTEWNGKYRDAVRAFWSGDDRGVAELATRLAGSNDLYEHSGRRPYASINFITAHDGFTLHDLVSYNEKHNEANGEGNRDGENHNLSWNCGVEGPTDDPRVIAAARAAEAEPHGDAAALAGRADDQRRRRARPHAAGQQQRLLPGQRTQLDMLESDAGAAGVSRIHTPARALPPLAAGADAPQVLPGTLHPRRRREGHLLARSERPRDDRRGLERTVRPIAWRAAWSAMPSTKSTSVDGW